MTVAIPSFRKAFLGYHYAGAAIAAAGYAAWGYWPRGPHALQRLDASTRDTLYLSLAGTSAVMLGFAVTAVAIFVTLGPGKGLDLLRRHDDFPYVRKVLMGAIASYAVATVYITTLLVLDSGHGRRWLEIAFIAVVAMALLRTLSLMWLLNRLLKLAILDSQAGT